MTLAWFMTNYGHTEVEPRYGHDGYPINLNLAISVNRELIDSRLDVPSQL